LLSDQYYRKSGSSARFYKCPDTDFKNITNVSLYSGISAVFSEDVMKWNTPVNNMYGFVSKDLTGTILSVLETEGTCYKTGARPSGTFYMCGPLQGIDGGACGTSCNVHSHAKYTKTGWDQRHMITSHEGGLF
jgi:hypothetical protein